MNKEDIEKAVTELKETLSDRFGSEIEVYLFGSVARDDYGAESDIDVLVLVPGEVDTEIEVDIIDLAYNIELKYDVVFGVLVNGKEFWESEKAAVMPFHQNLQREAIRL